MKSSREQFEKWFIKQYRKSRNGVETWSGEDDGDYISDYAASHWRAWQASRAAIEIELPRVIDAHPLGPQSAKMICAFHKNVVGECAEAIHAAGLIVKGDL